MRLIWLKIKCQTRQHATDEINSRKSEFGGALFNKFYQLVQNWTANSHPDETTNSVRPRHGVSRHQMMHAKREARNCGNYLPKYARAKLPLNPFFLCKLHNPQVGSKSTMRAATLRRWHCSPRR